MKGRGIYAACPHCGNVASGTEIRRCEKCGEVFCKVCEREGSYFLGPECPSCKGQLSNATYDNYKTLGNIA